MDQAAAYDSVAYPSGVFRRAQPDRMAVVARLHGLSPPPVPTARVLEIGGGDGLNLISAAAASPDARFVNFDIAPQPVARGQQWIAETGLRNVRVECLDAIDAAETLEGPFDYVIAHGVYAWVPAPVRRAVMRLIGRVLAPDGVALVSYNTLPGSHVNIALREMLVEALTGIETPQARMAETASILASFGQPCEGDPPFVTAMRDGARRMAARRSEVLWHDELNPAYDPQSFTAVTDAAHGEGLRYLGEADQGMIEDGFLDDEVTDRSTEVVLRLLRTQDYERGQIFRHSLFVRAAVQPERRLTSAPLEDMLIAMHAERIGPAKFRQTGVDIEVGAEELADRLEAVARVWPLPVPVRGRFGGKGDLDLLFRLFQASIADITTVSPRYVTEPGERPVASPLARAVVRAGGAFVPTLDQLNISFADPAPRAFLLLLDGTRDRAQLAAEWADDDGIGVEQALRSLARLALLIA